MDVNGVVYNLSKNKLSLSLAIKEAENKVKNDKPLISVSTHIDDNYVMDSELKIFIHKS